MLSSLPWHLHENSTLKSLPPLLRRRRGFYFSFFISLEGILETVYYLDTLPHQHMTRRLKKLRSCLVRNKAKIFLVLVPSISPKTPCGRAPHRRLLLPPCFFHISPRPRTLRIKLLTPPRTSLFRPVRNRLVVNAWSSFATPDSSSLCLFFFSLFGKKSPHPWVMT